MKLDLHIHSLHSHNCKTKVSALIRSAEESGLDAIAITDFDNMSAYKTAKKLTGNVVVIPAMEITTWKGTHIIGLFLKKEILSRDIFDIIDEIHEQGGLVLLPHPFRRISGLVYAKDKHNLYTAEDMRSILSRVDLVETVNSNDSPEEIINADSFFALMPDIPQVAGSGAHSPDRIGSAFVNLEDVKSNSLNDIKLALLNSPRTIRFEAYSIKSERKTMGTKVTVRNSSLITMARQLIISPLRKKIKTIFARSAEIMNDS